MSQAGQLVKKMDNVLSKSDNKMLARGPSDLATSGSLARRPGEEAPLQSREAQLEQRVLDLEETLRSYADFVRTMSENQERLYSNLATLSVTAAREFQARLEQDQRLEATLSTLSQKHEKLEATVDALYTGFDPRVACAPAVQSSAVMLATDHSAQDRSPPAAQPCSTQDSETHDTASRPKVHSSVSAMYLDQETALPDSPPAPQNTSPSSAKSTKVGKGIRSRVSAAGDTVFSHAPGVPVVLSSTLSPTWASDLLRPEQMWMRHRNEEVELQPSVWSAPLVMGLLPIGRAGSIMMLSLLAVNTMMQVASS